jgi:hypothetical protein
LTKKEEMFATKVRHDRMKSADETNGIPISKDRGTTIRLAQ